MMKKYILLALSSISFQAQDFNQNYWKNRIRPVFLEQLIANETKIIQDRTLLLNSVIFLKNTVDFLRVFTLR
jgi:hypothetical protein